MVFAIHQYELAIGVLVFPPSWNPLSHLSAPHPSRLSQSTAFGCPASYFKLPLSILQMVMYMCNATISIHPTLSFFWWVHKSLCLHLKKGYYWWSKMLLRFLLDCLRHIIQKYIENNSWYTFICSLNKDLFWTWQDNVAIWHVVGSHN